jgi:hypothetical protein
MCSTKRIPDLTYLTYLTHLTLVAASAALGLSVVEFL